MSKSILRGLSSLLPDGGVALSGLRQHINCRPDKRSAIRRCLLVATLLLAGCSHSQPEQKGRPTGVAGARRTGHATGAGHLSDGQFPAASYRQF
ncbi:Uncharacterised protein [Kluyvera intermedia]|nr:Uncharacterised protein [Kluyvera intermedia]